MILFVEIITKQSKSTSEGPIHQLPVLLWRKKRICKYANMVRVVVTTHYSESAGLHAPKAVFSLTCVFCGSGSLPRLWLSMYTSVLWLTLHLKHSFYNHQSIWTPASLCLGQVSVFHSGLLAGNDAWSCITARGEGEYEGEYSYLCHSA